MKVILIENGVLTIDPIKAAVRVDGELVLLSTKLYRFLMCFVQEMGNPVALEDVCKKLDISASNFYVRVNRIRTLIGQEFLQNAGKGKYVMPKKWLEDKDEKNNFAE